MVRKSCHKCLSNKLKSYYLLFILVVIFSTTHSWTSAAISCYECSTNSSMTCTERKFRTYDRVVTRDNCTYCQKMVQKKCFLFPCEVSRSCVASCQPGRVMVYNVTRAITYCCQRNLCNKATSTHQFQPSHVLILFYFIIVQYVS